MRSSMSKGFFLALPREAREKEPTNDDSANDCCARLKLLPTEDSASECFTRLKLSTIQATVLFASSSGSTGRTRLCLMFARSLWYPAPRYCRAM